MENALIIDPKDTVAVAIEPIAQGVPVCYLLGGQTHSLRAVQDIPIYHKLAVRAMPAGAPVVKYGEHIGVASVDIKPGEHVHLHNVASRRERLEEE